MHPIAHYAIAATILTSALGAFLLCLLVFRFGFEPPEDEAVEDRHRRHLVTRLGHAGGAVCFAITAGLSGVALGLPARPALEQPPAAVTPADLTALRSAHASLGDAVRALDARVAHAEASLAGLPASQAVSIERPAASRRVASAPGLERRPVAPGVRDEGRDSRPRPAATLDRRAVTERRAAAVEAAPAGNATETVADETAMPASPPDAVREVAASLPRAAVAAEPARAAQVASVAPVDVSTAKPGPAASSDEDFGSAARQVMSRLGGEVTRTLVRAGRNVRRFVEDLR